tara:strand:- start:237 stop:413 length:177 start_codon:yes stop_codon:yes gene_type:complete
VEAAVVPVVVINQALVLKAVAKVRVLAADLVVPPDLIEEPLHQTKIEQHKHQLRKSRP